MKVENQSGSAANTDGSAESDESTGSVSREAHQRLLDQRKADRARAKAAEERVAQLEADREATEAAKLAEANEFKKLFEAQKKKNEELETKLNQMTQSQVTNAKRAALSAALGITKTEYLNLADLAGVQMNDDGSVEPDSVKTVANKFREAYPELLSTRTAGRLPNDAPANGQPRAAKKLEDMSAAELRALHAKMRAAGK